MVLTLPELLPRAGTEDEYAYKARRGLPKWKGHARKLYGVVARYWFGWHWRRRALGWMGVSIGRTYVGRDCFFDEEVPELITIADRATISVRVIVMAHDTFLHTVSPVRIEKYVFIGAGAIILPGVTLHEGAVVAAGSVVNRSVPAYTMVAGAPARPIRVIPPEEHGLVPPPLGRGLPLTS